MVISWVLPANYLLQDCRNESVENIPTMIGSLLTLIRRDRVRLTPRLVLMPFFDRLSVYDRNRDGQIAHEEFVLAVLHSVLLIDVTKLRSPFEASDTNDFILILIRPIHVGNSRWMITKCEWNTHLHQNRRTMNLYVISSKNMTFKIIQ